MPTAADEIEPPETLLFREPRVGSPRVPTGAVTRPGARASRWRLISTIATSGKHDHAELRLDQRRQHGQREGAFRVAADQRRQCQHDHQRADRVGLTPERGVVPGDRIEQVHRRRYQAQPIRPVGLAEPAAHDVEDDDGDTDVGQHGRQLDQRRHPAGGRNDVDTLPSSQSTYM